MIARIAGWVGSALLTSALAFATAGTAASQNSAPPPALERSQCVCSPATAPVVSDLGDSLEALDLSQVGDAALALDDGPIALALQSPEGSFALQDDGQDGRSFRVFSSSDEGWLGIRMEEITADKARDLHLPAERGALLTYVAEDSPAAKAGLKTGDVITDFDGQRVESTLTLQRLVHEVPAGRKVSLSIWRDGHPQSLTVEISSRRASRSREDNGYWFGTEIPRMDIQIPAAPMPPIEIGPFSSFRMFGAPALGIEAEDLSGQLGNYFGAPDGEGILVREVMPGTPAEKAGLKAGDVILRLDGKRVKTAAELRSALRDKLSQSSEGADSGKTESPTADLTILRAGKESTVRIELQPPIRRVRPVHRAAA